MTDLPAGFYAGDVYCLVRGMPEEESVELIPGAPSIAAAPSGASMFDSPDGATLTLQARWAVDPAALPAIAAEIAKQRPAAAEVEPQPADLTSARASLKFIGKSGETYTVGPNDSSGLSGSAVVFSVTLTSTEKQRALAAMGGATGSMELTYEADLDLREEAEARLAGDLAADLSAMLPEPAKPEKGEHGGGLFGWGKRKPPPPPPPPPLPTLEACARRVETAIVEGRLALTRRSTPNTSAALQDKVATGVKELAARALFEAAGAGGGMTRLPVDFRRSDAELRTFRIERTADLGHVLAAAGAERLVRRAPVAIASPRR